MTVYICSPYRAETEDERRRNIQYAIGLTKKAIEMGYAPITPHLYLPYALDDNDQTQRDRALEIDSELVSVCDVVLLGDRYGISAGMEMEIETAKLNNIPVVPITPTMPPMTGWEHWESDAPNELGYTGRRYDAE